jgi:DUF438 domain-containing protein
MEELAAFVRGLINGENGKQLIEQHQQVIETVSATEAMIVLDQMFAEGFSNEIIKANVGKIINVFFKSLNAQTWEKPGSNHFLHYLMLENRQVESIMTEMKKVVKSLYKDDNQNEQLLYNELREYLEKLKSYELHYIKKENILFPYIEKVFPQFRCLKLMWSFHDDFRKSLKILDQILSSSNPDKEVLNKELGKLFFVVLPLVFREEQIVYPVACRAIPENSWNDMLQQSFEIGWCYINPPPLIMDKKRAIIPDGLVNLGTGHLSAEQLILLFDHLPLDITFVDEKDEVCYFSGIKHRVFPRSKAIIGRKVQNCHPPESVHMVNEILAAFRNGSRDHADFWIERKGRFIHIRYFAIRDENSQYKGTIEVTQDVTEIRQLTGQRRLLEWS